jgi:hypothetical protein
MMGECGCGGSFGDFHFPGPDGTLYTLEVYEGCETCETPLGVALSRYTKHAPSGDLACVEALPEAPWNIRDEVPLPLLDLDIVRSQLGEYLLAGIHEVPSEELDQEFVEDLLKEAFREMFREMLHASRVKWEKVAPPSRPRPYVPKV